MAEGDESGRGEGRDRDNPPAAGLPASASRPLRDRGPGGDGSDLVKPSWDHSKDYPEALAEGRTSTAVAIGLVAAALLGGGLWLAMRVPDGERTRPSAAAPTGVPETRPEVVPTAAPTWAPLGESGAPLAPPSPTAAAAARPTGADGTTAPGVTTGRGPGALPGIDRPRRPRPTPSDPRRAQWRQRLDRLRDERRSILRDESLSREQKRDRVEELLRRQFRSQNPVPPPPPDLAR